MVAATLAPSNYRGADPGVAIAADQENAVERDSRAGVAIELFDAQHVANPNPILLSAGLDDGVLRIVAGR